MTDHNHTKATYTRLYISILKKIKQRRKIWLGFFIYQKHFRTPPERAIFYAKVNLSALEKKNQYGEEKNHTLSIGFGREHKTDTHTHTRKKR